ncbi:hypothetical protein DY000_02059434 [Brassica cretica]|uniref:Uncharacterized protein n=1 Tax=Brassica cretica TaxID=69181 RepID=A0ABQ7AVP4_BRACR|nr:hypothetical protein DY000_02059434 [Brassica cretica]
MWQATPIFTHKGIFAFILSLIFLISANCYVDVLVNDTYIFYLLSGNAEETYSSEKKDPISKTAAPPSKKTSATTSLSNAESEKKKLNFLCLLVYRDLVHISIKMSWISYLMMRTLQR